MGIVELRSGDSKAALLAAEALTVGVRPVHDPRVAAACW